MHEYLVFHLYGPIASWGLPAVGGARGTATHPTRAAVLGLVSAALGVVREDTERLTMVDRSLLVAVKQCTQSSILRDYHTAQVPPQKRKVHHYTRRSELASDDLETILSTRDYRTDGYWVVALQPTADADIALQDVATALRRPKFTLYLGRKSCPLAAPLRPVILAAVNLQAALDTEFPELLPKGYERRRLNRNSATYYWEGAEDAIDLPGRSSSRPWDQPISRIRWQFKQRTQYQVTVES